MNIALCTDDRYANHCAICVTSILENNRNESCQIYILTEGLSEDNCRKFDFLSQYYHQEIIIEIIDIERLKSLQVTDRLPYSIYFRFLLPQIINADRVLYLDCDIIVRHSLTSLFQCNLENYACAVVEDQCNDDVRIHNRIMMFSCYFNSGVLLMNLEYWRKYNISSQLIQYIMDYPGNLICPDQDALNVVLEHKKKLLDYTYNFQQGFYNELTWLRADKWSIIEKSRENPFILHYTSGEKPWHIDCTHPLKRDYEYYRGLHDILREKETYGHSKSFYIIERVVAILRKCYQKFRKNNGMIVNQV